MASTIRSLVSKKKKRFQEHGFDLDLTYVTPRIIAMGFPSQGYEAAFRNPLSEVQRFFNTRHKDHYKVYNLCAERGYDLTGLFHCVERFPFSDHNACPFELIKMFCQSVDEWLAADKENVVGVHCKAGKGRTGLAIAAYLVHSGMFKTAEDALEKFGLERTTDGKGVTIPSQKRYIHYYESYLDNPIEDTPTFQLIHVRFITTPNFDVGGGSNPYFQLRHARVTMDAGKNIQYREAMIYNHKDHDKNLRKFKAEDPYVDIECTYVPVLLHGDIKFVFLDHDAFGSDEKMFHFWINTRFIEGNYLCLEKKHLDKACKDKKHKSFPAGFKIELFLNKLEISDTKEYELDVDDEMRSSGTEDEEVDPA